MRMQMQFTPARDKSVISPFANGNRFEVRVRIAAYSP